MEAFIFDPTEKALLAAAGILFVIQLLYYFCLYNRIWLHNRAVRREAVHFSKELPPISVIIAAHNEVEHLRNNLPAILEQDYPDFEVIVINNGKTDESEEFLTLMEEQYHNLYHSFVPDSSRYISRKKLAIMLGIRASKHEWLVLTGADCRPVSNQWLRRMARNFTTRTEVVLGYSGYERGKGWLHKQAAFDNLFTSLRYLGFALAGSPYMGIGRNLAYRKQLFYEQKGFTEHLNLQRGDDDLFINHVANAANTRVETDEASIVRMQPVERPKDWREEKIGYASTARLYHGLQRWMAGLETSTRLAFHAAWVGTLVVGIVHFHWLAAGIAFLLFLLRFVVQAVVVNKAADELGEKRHYYLSLPAFDLLQPMQSLRWKLYCLFRRKSDFLRK